VIPKSEADPRGIIWERVDRLVDSSPGLADLRAHGLQLLAARRWRSLGQPVPVDVVSEELWAVLRNRAARTLLERIRATCEGPIILIKGPAIGAYYPDPALRPFHDLDLLVSDAAAAERALLAAGFEPSPAQLHPETIHHLRPLRMPEIPLYVELHRYPKWIEGLPPPSLDELLAGTEPAALGVDGILTLTPSYHALVVTAHLWAHDPLVRLLRVVDVAVLAEAADWPELDALAAAWRMTKPWNTTIAVARSLLYDEQPPWALRIWARHLPAVREATVVDLQLGRLLSAFSVLPPRRAMRTLGKALRGDLRPLPNESWRRKLERTAEQLRRPSMRGSEHIRSAQASWVEWTASTPPSSPVPERAPSSPPLDEPSAATPSPNSPPQSSPAPLSEPSTGNPSPSSQLQLSQAPLDGPALTEPGVDGEVRESRSAAALDASQAPRGLRATRTSSLAWLLASTVWGGAAALAMGLDAEPAYRAPIVLGYVLVCPGLALVRLLGVPAAMAQISLGVALSLALDVLIPAALLYAGAWSPPAALAILIGLTVAAAILEFLSSAPWIRFRLR
jgi:hypothetical protein